MTFTIEQLEALKEGTTPGPWSIDSSDPDWPQLVGALVLEGNLITQEILAEVGGELNDPNLYLAAAAPALVDALIAEKRAHQKLRSEVEGMKSAFEDRPSPHDDYVYAQGWEYALDLVDTDLTRILEGTQ